MTPITNRLNPMGLVILILCDIFNRFDSCQTIPKCRLHL